MTKIIFIEGVSGVGKTTLVKSLHKLLRTGGHVVKSYIEFDFTNPIDFYCTAYFLNDQYQNLCQNYPEEIAQIKKYSVPAGSATLVRYFDEDTPLFLWQIIQKRIRQYGRASTGRSTVRWIFIFLTARSCITR